jgi:hypothetical protein
MERLHPKFVRNYFICLDENDFASQGVLVRLNWDKDISGGVETMKRLKIDENAEVWRVPIKGVYEAVVEVVEGGKACGVKKLEEAGLISGELEGSHI